MNIENPGSNSRRSFLKRFGVISAALVTDPVKSIAQVTNTSEQIANHSEFKKTGEQFKNGEFVYTLESDGVKVGEFWPIKGINLVTKDTSPELFDGSKSVEDIQKSLKGVATSPDGMTTGSTGAYEMQGKSLANGVECGDGVVYNYGIVNVKNGYDITFTHKLEIDDYDAYFNKAKTNKETIIFLPSIYRTDPKGEKKFLSSTNKIDKAIIRRVVPGGVQMGVIIFDKLTTYDDAREIILGLNRKDEKTNTIISDTTHIYVLDGGPLWGQSVKEVNGKVVEVGIRNTSVVTNYLVYY